MQDDDILAGKVKEGERNAFDSLYNKYKERIFNYIKRILGDRETAAELTQEVFISVYLNIKGYEMRGFFKAWIYKIASNLTKNALKKRRDDVSLSKPIDDCGTGATLADIIADESLSSENIIKNEELKTQMAVVLDSLEPMHKEILVLCIIEELSYEEAAKVLGINVKTVSSRLARARKKFMQKMNTLRNG